MKEFFGFLLSVVYFFGIFTPSFALNTTNKTEDCIVKKYNLDKTQIDYLRYSCGYRCVESDWKWFEEEWLKTNLLDEVMESLKIPYPNKTDAFDFYKGLKANNSDVLEHRGYISSFTVVIDGKVYDKDNIKKINIKNISKNTKIIVFDKNFYGNRKSVKKYLEFKKKYGFSDEKMNRIVRDTNKFRANVGFIKKAIDEGFYDTYCSNCDIASYKKFKKRYKLAKKLEKMNNLSSDTKKKILNGSDDFARVGDKYYKNIYKVKDEDLKNPDNIQFYSKQKYRHKDIKTLKALKTYIYFQEKYNFDNAKMKRVAIDTNRFTKNIKLVEKAINDGTYEDYYRYMDENYLSYANSYRGYQFKDNYKSLQLLKENGNFSDEEISNIVSESVFPAIIVGPKYWGSKDKKVKKVLNDKKIKKEDKYSAIKEKYSYRKASAKELAVDTALRTGVSLLYVSIIGLPVGIIIFALLRDGTTFLPLFRF